MRKRPSTQPNSEVVFSLSDAKKLLLEMEERISRLEAQAFGTGIYLEETAPIKRSKGRPPRLDPKEVHERRDKSANWLERNWPFLSVALRQAKTPRDVTNAIQEAAKRKPLVFPQPYFCEPEKHEEALWQFLQSGRFCGNPRNLAAAIAGFPEYTWKRSFDICSGHPYIALPAVEAYWDYMRRNFPDRLRELGATKTPEQVKAVLRKSHTQDPIYLHLKKNPEKVLEWLNAGKPSVN